MSNWIDDQAEVSDNDEDIRRPAKKRPRMESDDDDDEDEEEEDESKIAEEMEGFVVTGDDEEEEGEGEDDKKSESDESEQELEEEDAELVMENLGIQKRRKGRIQIGSDEEDEGGGDNERQVLERQLFDAADDDGQRRPPKPRRQATGDEDEGGRSGSEESVDSDEMVGFIEDEDEQGEVRHKPKSKNRRLPVSDQALEEARDIFGVDFDYEDICGEEEGEEGEEEDVEEIGEDGEERRVSRKVTTKKKPLRRTLLEQIEPSELERGFLSELDKKIQQEDKPERYQLRTKPITEADESELIAEASWIYSNAFCAYPISQQAADDPKPVTVMHRIKDALNFMRNQDFEIPFIAFYRKEYVEDPQIKEGSLTIKNLWKVYQWDEKWCELQNRKKNLSHLFQRMQDYQFNVVMEDSNRPVGEETRALTDEDCAEIFKVHNQEELQDVYSYFLLYYGRDLPKMTAYEKMKEAQERGEEAEHQPKQASRRDKYSICASAGLGSFVKLFGLTPKQFAKNLENNYLIEEVEQHQDEPLKVAEGYINSQFSAPEDVIKGATYMAAMQLAREPMVRRVMRQKYRNQATIAVRPTKKGRKEIDENHPIYTKKYLKNKPAKEFKDDEFLKLLQAEENGLIKITISVDSADGDRETMCKQIVDSGIYRRDEYTKAVQEWNALRDDVVKVCIEEILYPILEKELKIKLIQEAKDYVLRACTNKCYDALKIAPYQMPDEKENDDQPPTLMAIAYTKETDQASFAAALNADGEVLDHLRLLHLMKRRNSFREAEKRLKEQELETLKKFIVTKNVRVIAIAGEALEALTIRDDLKYVIDQLDEEQQISIEFVDNELAKVYMDSKRAQTDFPDYPLLLRQAISLGRRLLDPLLEFSQLFNQDEELLCLKFHPLQDLLPKDDLLNTLMWEFINRANEVGVDVNRCSEHPHMSSILQFVCGLGPRKAAYLLKVLRQNGSILENRTKLVTLCHMGPKVFMNCAGFIKIDTAKVAEKSEVYVEVLDGSRVHPETYEWARKMAVDALEYDDTSEDANPASALEEILEAPERLKDLDLDAFAEELERQGFGNKNVTLYDIRAELNHRYKDLRTPYRPPDPEELFTMLTKETPQTFDVGKLVMGRVINIVHRKPQLDQLDHTNPIRNDQTGLWQCPHCLKNDFFELSAVWQHFDSKQCSGQAIGVRVRLENGISGFIPTKDISDKGVKNPEERVTPGMPINCRITKIDRNRFSVDLTCKTSDLLDRDKRYKPPNDRHYDYQAEDEDRNEEQKMLQAKKRAQFLQRVIAHDAFHNCSFRDAERMLANAEQGDVIIRPSSKGNDHLTVTWKVADGVYQHIDVKEEGKENAFSLGRALYINEELYEDLDEIIARYINPMAANVREILNYKYYFPSTEREEIESHVQREKEENQNRIPYVLTASKDVPGKFLLSYLPVKTVRHEFVSVIPDGFRYRQTPFRTLNDLLKWFKEHYREPPPGAARVGATPLDQQSAYGTPRFDVMSHAASAMGHQIQTPSGWRNTPVAPMMAASHMNMPSSYGTPGQMAQANRYSMQPPPPSAGQFVTAGWMPGANAQMPNQQPFAMPSTPGGGVREHVQSYARRQYGKGAADDWSTTARNWARTRRETEGTPNSYGNPIPHTYDRGDRGGGRGGGNRHGSGDYQRYGGRGGGRRGGGHHGGHY